MNRLPGTISAVEVQGSIALVDVAVDDRCFTAALIGTGQEAAAWVPGTRVALLFKETEVSLAKQLSGLISLRNRIPATVTRIDSGRVLTKVTLDFHGHRIESVITTRSSLALQLAVGDAVEGLVKANEMAVLPEGTA
jgi:molybdate transport system regulatory protein